MTERGTVVSQISKSSFSDFGKTSFGSTSGRDSQSGILVSKQNLSTSLHRGNFLQDTQDRGRRYDTEPHEIVQREHSLMRSVALSEGLRAHRNTTSTTGFLPLYHHPLPVSHRRYAHEQTLRKVLSCRESFQAMAAITRGDAWVLEEVYIRGGRKVLEGKNGAAPIHLAVQRRSLDAVMVLINIGVDLNEVNSMGFTPLFIAHSLGANEIEQLLIENGAKMNIDLSQGAPVSTALDVHPERQSVRIKSNASKFLQMPATPSLY